MADKQGERFSLKALVDKRNQKIIFVESDEKFVDILFSFLATPLGVITKLTHKLQPTVDIGCMNLHRSVENLDVKHLRTKVCKTMLLCPESGATEAHFWDISGPIRCFLCISNYCTKSQHKLLSIHEGTSCYCGNPMTREVSLYTKGTEKLACAGGDGVFVKGRGRFSVTDDLQVKPLSTASSFSLLSKLGVVDSSTIEERIFDLGVNEILILLKRSIVSKAPLTETLLKHDPFSQMSKSFLYQGNSNQSQKKPDTSSGNGKLCIKIMVSKTRNQVCYAEAGKDFIDLLFSFLTLPLGYIVKQKQNWSFKGCIDHLYTSVQDLNAESYIKSDEHKKMLASPKVAPFFRYENQPLSTEEALHPIYYYGPHKLLKYDALTIDKTLICDGKCVVLTLLDPKSQYKGATNGGFVEGTTIFTVTDSLVVTPVSSISAISLLNKLKVPINDIEERTLYLGNDEASRLLIASLESETALTDAFIQREPKKEKMEASSLSESAIAKAYIRKEPKQEPLET